MEPLLIAVYVLVPALRVAGLVGSVLPFLAETLLILAGALVYALMNDFSPIGGGREANTGNDR